VLNVVARGLVAVPGISPQRFGLHWSGQGSNGVFAVLRWCPCLHCTGIIASITCCWCCAGVVAKLAFKGPAGATLAFAGIALAIRLHSAGVIASFVLSSLLPALRRRHCPCHVGAFALVVLALLPSLPLCCCQHCKLASALSQSSRNTCWCHCQHCAIVVAGVVPALLPMLRGHLCPHCTVITAFSTPALPPASQTGIWPVMMQLQHIAGEASLLHSLSLPVASLLYPVVGPQQFSLRRSGQGSDGIFFLFFFFLFLALLWCPCPHCTGVIASVKLSLLPALRRRCHQVGLQRSGWYSAGVCRRCAGVLPALHWRHCQHCAAVILAGVAPALSPLVHGCLCPHRAPLVVAFALPSSLPYVASLPYPVLFTPVFHFLSPDALVAMHVPLP
jgi:hypothetical protein